jgi:hypothetical protein
MSIYTKWLIPLSAFCVLVIIGAVSIVISGPTVDINRELPISQVNLAKIYVVGSEIRKDMQVQPEIYEEELGGEALSDDDIKDILIHGQNYNQCYNIYTGTWKNFDGCKDTITQREVDLVRLAYTDLDSFRIEVEE